MNELVLVLTGRKVKHGKEYKDEITANANAIHFKSAICSKPYWVFMGETPCYLA
jgi:hypothetical protein